MSLVSTFAGQAFASNPADATADFRYCPVEFYKVAWDDGPYWFLAIEPLGNDTALTLFNWNSEGCDEQLYEVALTKRYPEKGLEVAAIADANKGERDTLRLMLDWSQGRFGIGAVVPADSRDPLKVGARYTTGKLTWYLSGTEAGTSPTAVGVSYCEKGAKLELARSGETWFFRASKPAGKLIPELRIKFTEEESFVGFGLAFCPG